jgi:pre-mRNA-processing factor 17
MDTLNDYGSSSSDNDDDNDLENLNQKRHKPQQQTIVKRSIADKEQNSTLMKNTAGAEVVGAINVIRPDRRLLNAAPAVSLLAGRTSLGSVNASNTDNNALSMLQRKRPATESTGLVLMNNPTKALMYQPMQGPQGTDPTASRKARKKGVTESNVAYDYTNFNEQRTAFQRDGIANAPVEDGNILAIRTTLGYTNSRLEQMVNVEQNRSIRPIQTKDMTALVEGSDDEIEYGIWGPPGIEEQYEVENSLSIIQKGEELLPQQLAEREYIAERNRQKGIEEQQAEEESAYDRRVERKMAHLLPPGINSNKQSGPVEATTTFHGTNEIDYKGRTWMAPPAGLGNVLANGGSDQVNCKVPKKCIHRFTGHNQGVHRIRLFPITGHLLLSGGFDGKCKVWSISEKQVMRTYIGHSAGVRDVQFNNNGLKFLSASFDRYIRLWDTENGTVLQTFFNRKVPYVVKFYPKDDNYFVVGCSDNKIITYNTTTAEITQEYNHHLGPVNAIVFVDDATKMITSSDDKKILVWEWDIGVPIKYIMDPSMHSMPCMTVHPSHNYFVGQSLDNTIVVFSTGTRITIQRKKKFTGHIVSGYACEIDFSPDGHYMISGDGTGSMFVWDWKRHKILQKFRAHTDGPASCCVWHPLEPSTVFSCGWDGIIKMWQ